MNKNIEKFLAEQGLTVTGDKAYGFLRGYETNVIVNNRDTSSPFRMHISFYATDEQKNRMGSEFNASKIGFLRFQFTPYGVFIGLNGWTLNSMIKKLPEYLDLFFKTIEANGGLNKNYCPVCATQIGGEFPAEEQPSSEQTLVSEGAEEVKPAPAGKPETRRCDVDGYMITMDVGCVDKINAIITADNKAFEEAPNNYVKGFIGAALGGLVGGILTAILYFIGFVSAISAVVAVLLGAFLYQKLGGKPNKMMIVIVSVTSLVFMLLSVVVVYLIATGIAINSEGLEMGVFEAFGLLMSESAEFSRMFWLDFGLVFLFSAIGIGIEIFTLSRQIQRKKNIR